MAEAALEEIVERLERAARGLRDPELGSERAAELADECARLAGEAAERLERELRASEASGPGRDQMRLQDA